jgi:hypothetical protein
MKWVNLNQNEGKINSKFGSEWYIYIKTGNFSSNLSPWIPQIEAFAKRGDVVSFLEKRKKNIYFLFTE